MPENLPEFALEISNLTKRYGKSRLMPEKLALEDVSLQVPRGSLFALLGPNGAGKSTLINILAGLVMKSEGNVRIWDIDIDKDARNARNAIGIVPQELNLAAFFTPKRLLDLNAGLYGVPKELRRTTEILRTIGLEDKADAYSRTLSGGMRRRLLVGKAMVHNPPVLVLDEPTAGVDIELRRQLWDNIQEMNAQGVTVMLTTHYLEEAQELCDRIAIINHGKLIANEKKATLLKRVDSKSIVVTLQSAIEKVPASLQDYTVQLGQLDGQQTLSIQYRPSETQGAQILAAVMAAQLDIADINTTEIDLEDVFLQLITE
ncbi:MAG: ABC transporter ATP-binding protein [Pseudomonadota bacterium]